VSVGITNPNDDPSNTGLDEGVTARTGATGVITRLECGVERRTAYRVGSGGIERDSLRMAAAGRFGGTIEDLPVEGDDNGANPGVGRGRVADPGGVGDRSLHERQVVDHP
jgi:hypothetical protein